VSVTDAQGRVVPTVDNFITLELTSPGEGDPSLRGP